MVKGGFLCWQVRPNVAVCALPPIRFPIPERRRFFFQMAWNKVGRFIRENAARRRRAPGTGPAPPEWCRTSPEWGPTPPAWGRNGRHTGQRTDQPFDDVVSPRLYEYLATGKPVVSMMWPDQVELPRAVLRW